MTNPERIYHAVCTCHHWLQNLLLFMISTSSYLKDINRRESMRNIRHKKTTNDPQKKYRVGTVSKNILLKGLNRFEVTKAHNSA